ncbi:MAG: hypothetical protein ABWK01_06340 [Infirmifilum sp.]
MKHARLVFARASLHWGFVVRQLQATAAQLALALAPPTTIVGAFAAPLLRTLGFVDKALRRSGTHKTLSAHFECALRASLAASMGVLPREMQEGAAGLSVHEELSRLSAGSYKGGGAWEEALKASPGSFKFYSKFITEALPVQAVGAAYGPGVKVDLVWVFDASKLATCLSGLDISIEDLDKAGVAAAYGVSRLGSKEGILSVEDAKYLRFGDAELRLAKAGEVFETHTYVPAECAEPLVGGSAATVELWDFDYQPKRFWAPALSNVAIVFAPSRSALPKYRVADDCTACIIRVGDLDAVALFGGAVGGGDRE